MAFSHIPRDFHTITGTPKPDLPYTKGQEWTVTEHFPSEPPKSTSYTLDEHADEQAEEQALIERRDVDALKRCVRHPPSSGQLGHHTLRLRIVDTIRVGDEKTSQIVLVVILSGQKHATRAVAKLYDPLYFDHTEFDVDPFQSADVEYMRESAAYRRLSAREERNIPAFYGSYTLELTVPPASSRLVRLILLEYIRGKPMNTIKPRKLSQPYRKAIMKQIVSAETRFFEKDVSHDDVFRRNIIIQGLGSDPSKLQIVFVDFGSADIGRLCDPVVCKIENCLLPGTYISPILRWDGDNVNPLTDDFEAWIDWDWNDWLREEYSEDIEGITPYMESLFLLHPRYVPEEETY